LNYCTGLRYHPEMKCILIKKKKVRISKKITLISGSHHGYGFLKKGTEDWLLDNLNETDIDISLTVTLHLHKNIWVYGKFFYLASRFLIKFKINKCMTTVNFPQGN